MKKNLKKIVALVAMATTMMGTTAFAAEVKDEQTGTAPLTASCDFDVTFNQADSISLTLSTDVIDFGEVTGLVERTDHTPAEMTVTVESSKTYDVAVKATSDFVGQDTGVNDDKTIPIDKLSFAKDGGEYVNFAAKDTDYTFVSDAAATLGTPATCNLGFKLGKTIGYAAGNYKADLTVTATQK